MASNHLALFFTYDEYIFFEIAGSLYKGNRESVMFLTFSCSYVSDISISKLIDRQ